MPMVADDPQRALAVNLLLEPTQGLVNGLALSQFNFRQIIVTSSPWTSDARPSGDGPLRSKPVKYAPARPAVNLHPGNVLAFVTVTQV